MTFNDWLAQYLKAGGIEHFNLMADEESARAAWEAAYKACAAKVEGNYGWVDGVYFDDLAEALKD